MALEQTVGVVGIGNMGKWMVKHLVDDGYDVFAYDVDKEAREAATEFGATTVDSVSSLGKKASIVLVVVPTGEHVKEVCLGDSGLFTTLTQGTVVINSSVAPKLPQEIQESAPNEVDIIDAPMTRGAAAAESGTIMFLVGGRDETIDRIRPVFESCGEIRILGELGAGQIGKTANNMLYLTSLLADYEMLELARESSIEIDPLDLREALEHTSGDNWPMRKGNWEALRLTWPQKDFEITLKHAAETDISLPVCGLASELIKELSVNDLEEFYFEEYR